MVKSDPKSDPKNAARRKKRAKVEKPVAENDYFTEKRNLDDLWHQIFPAVGTDSDLMVADIVLKYKWNFSNLEAAFEEGGELHDKNVYLFGKTQITSILVQGESKITVVPSVIAVVSPIPPSDKIGFVREFAPTDNMRIISERSKVEEIVPMKQMKMDWIPYTPVDKRLSQDDTKIFILSCSEMRDALGHLKKERIKDYERCLPYFCNPFKEDERTTAVFVYPKSSKSERFWVTFDWKVHELEEYTDEIIEKEWLAADQKESFKECLKEKVGEAKREKEEAREALRKAREGLDESMKAVFQNMKFLKFYPVFTPDSPEASITKSPFINMFYGKAHKVI